MDMRVFRAIGPWEALPHCMTPVTRLNPAPVEAVRSLFSTAPSAAVRTVDTDGDLVR